MADQKRLNSQAIKAKLTGELAPEDFEAVKESIAEETKKIQTALSVLESERKTLEEVSRQSKLEIISLVNTWRNATLEGKIELQKTLFARECPAIEIDTSLGGLRMRRVLDRIASERGLPEAIVLDNGPEFRGRVLAAWSEERGVRLEFIQPGKPTQNAYIESFNGRLRDECLNANWFTSLSDARRKIETWRLDYNQQRPHSSLGYLPPAGFARTRAEVSA
jgi:hypothetical protein